jgi:CheY-like chemotaxis protein
MTALRVLLVEDEDLIRLVTIETLQDEGFEVIEAWDGSEAARLLDGQNSFDVLFTDVQMPGTLDGIDVAMHARRRYPMIPVVIVSGYAVDLTRRLAVLEPAAVFISKPYNLVKIVDTLRRLTLNL